MMEHLGWVTTMGWAWFIVEWLEVKYANYRLSRYLRMILLKPNMGDSNVD